LLSGKKAEHFKQLLETRISELNRVLAAADSSVRKQESKADVWGFPPPVALFALSRQFRFPEGEPRQHAHAHQHNADSR
jgi:hypothetical protein